MSIFSGGLFLPQFHASTTIGLDTTQAFRILMTQSGYWTEPVTRNHSLMKVDSTTCINNRPTARNQVENFFGYVNTSSTVDFLDNL